MICRQVSADSTPQKSHSQDFKGESPQEGGKGEPLGAPLPHAPPSIPAPTPQHRPGVPGALGHPWNPPPPITPRPRPFGPEGAWWGEDTPRPSAPSQCRQGAHVHPKIGENPGVQQSPTKSGCPGEAPPNSVGALWSGRALQIPGASCCPGDPPKFGKDPVVRAAPAPSWGPHQGWGGGFGSARVFPPRAEAPEGCQEVFGCFRIHLGVSASLGYFRLYSGSRPRGRRSALPAALGVKYRRKLRVTPS